jgi:hypothetical protein
MKNFIKKNEKIITYFLIALIIFLIILILYSFFLNYKQNGYLFDLKHNIKIVQENCDIQLKKNMVIEKNLNEYIKKEETPSTYTIFLLLSVTFITGFTVAGNMDTGQQSDRTLMNLRHWANSGVLTFGNLSGLQSYTLLDADIVVTPTQTNKTLYGIRYRPTISGTALLFHYAATFASGQIGIGTETPNSSAIVDITSTTKGVLFPRMTSTQKNAITGVAGLVIYDTTLNKLCVYTTAWETITSI